MVQTTPQRKDRTRLVVILGIVATMLFAVSVGVATLSAATKAETARKASCVENVANINTQVGRWYFETGAWPAADLHDLACDTRHFPNGIPLCPVNGAAYVLDPATHRVKDHAH